MAAPKRTGLRRTRRRREAGQSPQDQYSIEQVAEALRKNGGRISHAAKSLKCSYQAVSDYLKKYPELQDVRDETFESRIDTAEHQLDRHVKGGSLDATKFILKTQGKKRGYSERTEVTAADGKPFELTIVPAQRPEEKDITPNKEKIEE